MRYDFDQVHDRRNTHSSKWQLEGRDLLPMWVADMDFQAPPPVVEAIERRARHGIFGYSMPGEGFYDAVAGWLERRHGWEIRKQWITFCPGIVPGLNMMVRALTHPGEKIIVQTPVYYPFYDVIVNNGCRIERNPLILEGGRYRMDVDDLERRARDPKVTAIILCSPHNPVGRVWTREELTRLGRICSDNEVLVISDELHFDLVLEGHTHTPFATLGDTFASNSITCIAPSKTFNLAGLQASTLIIPNKRLRNRYLNGSILNRPNPFGIVALEAAYNHGEAWLEQLLEYLEGNLQFLREFLESRLPMIDLIEPEATYLAWIDFRALGLNKRALEDLMLNKAGVWLDEGYIFGEEGDGFERINLACPRSLLAEALGRIEAAVSNL